MSRIRLSCLWLMAASKEGLPGRALAGPKGASTPNLNVRASAGERSRRLCGGYGSAGQRLARSGRSLSSYAQPRPMMTRTRAGLAVAGFIVIAPAASAEEPRGLANQSLDH